MIKAIATDLDGTLFYPKRKLRLMRSKNKKFLKRFIAEGKKVILVTGRNQSVSQKVAIRLKTNEMTIIGCNGGLVIQNGKIIKENPIDHETAKELYSLLCKDEKIRSILVFTADNIIVDHEPLNALERMVGKIGMNAQGVYNEPYEFGRKKVIDLLNDESRKIFKIMPWYGLQKNGVELARLATIKYQESVGDKFEVAWSKDAVEFVTKGVNKAIVLKEILDDFSIEKDEVLVAGDSGNDLPLFENFPNSFVMSHAPEQVKSQAKHVIEIVADLENYCK